MVCECLITFLLVLTADEARINPGSFQWQPERCLAGALFGSKPGLPGLSLERKYHDGKVIVTLPLPPRGTYGEYAYTYCWGQKLVTVNGYSRSVIITVIQEELAYDPTLDQRETVQGPSA